MCVIIHLRMVDIMNFKKITKIFFAFVFLILLTGCRRVKLEYRGEDLNISFKAIQKYNITKDRNFFRTAREEGMVVGDKFKIGIEHPIAIKNKKEFDKFMKEHKNEEDFKEIKYSGYKGFIFYTPPYIRYEIYLNIDNKNIVRFNIYSANDKKKFQTEALNSKDVQYLLKHMKIEVK